MNINKTLSLSLIATSIMMFGVAANGCKKTENGNSVTVEQLEKEIQELEKIHYADSVAYLTADLGKASRDLQNIKKIVANYIYGDSAKKNINMSTENLKNELMSNNRLLDDDMNQRCCAALEIAQKNYDVATGSAMRNTNRLINQKKAELNKK